MTESALPSPPAWSIFLGDAGRVIVIVSVLFFVLSLLIWLVETKSAKAQNLAKLAFTLGCSGLFATFAILGVLFSNNRFEYEYVWKHADSSNTLPYRIAGIWSGQQGSFLLWGVAAAVFGMLVVRKVGSYRRWFTIIYSTFLGSICGILAYESPFGLNMVEGRVIVPPDGLGLSPSLQNYWVIIHPPTIFLGFGSLTALFALAAAAAIQKDYETWVPIVRPWALVSMALVGLGLCMGGFWAYETLGWGGFWMWDPVENVSFVPWLLTTAFVHGIIVQTTKKKWKVSNILLGGLPFIAFVYGTFLTRSGFLADASVHSFAEMNRSALKLLVGLMGVSTLGFMGLWFARWFKQVPEPVAEAPAKLHREGFYKLGTVTLIGLGLAALIGMSVPLFMALSGKKPTVVEEHAYHLVLPWLFVPLMILMAIAPFISWKGTSTVDMAKRAYTILCVTFGLVGLLLLAIALTPMGQLADLHGFVTFPRGIHVPTLPWVLFLVGLCLFSIVGNVWRMSEILKGSKLGLAPFVTHLGVAVLMFGLIISRGFERKEQTFVTETHPGLTNSYLIKYAGQTSERKDRNNKVRFEVYDKNDPKKPMFIATPGLYYVAAEDGQENAMVWPHIQRYAFHDVYMALQPPQTQSSDPITLAPNEPKVVGDTVVTYLGMVREGQPGQVGTKFGARVKFAKGGISKIVVPKMELGSGAGPIQHPEAIDGLTNVSLMGMDIASGTVTLQLELASKVYPIELYHKPFTSLVWSGCGIMTFGGLLSAYYRRRVRVAEAAKAEKNKSKAKSPKDKELVPA